jgi:uncharacterized protein (TIGR00645 family)
MTDMTEPASPPVPRHVIERWIEWTLYSSRWLLTPLYIGLAIVLLVFVYKFAEDTVLLFANAVIASEADLVLASLALVDLVLVASLLLMVMISGYENFVSRIDLDHTQEKLAWFGKLDSGTLKVKVASSIVAISAIHLLRVFLNIEHIPNDKVVLLIAIHLTFVVSAVMLGVLDKLTSGSRAG